MILDYGGAWIAEIIMKYFFADNHPKAIITRGIERREARRALELKDAAAATAVEVKSSLAVKKVQ